MRTMHKPFPALRYRLISCVLNPYILLPHALFLITIWLMVSIQNANRDASTGTSTFTTIATATSTPSRQTLTITSNVTASGTSRHSPSATDVEPQIRNYLAAKASDAAQVLNGELQGYVSNINSKLTNWDTSIKTQLSIWEQHYMSLQQYNQSIYSNLESQSNELDSTVQYLTSNGLLVSTGSLPNSLQGLQLNVTFLESIFSNVSSSLDEIKNKHTFYPRNVSLTPISFDEVHGWISNDTAIESSFRSLVNSLQTAIPKTSSKSVRKRRDLENVANTNYRQKGIKLSALFCVTFVVCATLMMCVENLIFRIEMSRLRLTSEQLLAQSWEKINFDNTIYRLHVQGDFQDILVSYAGFAKFPIACTLSDVLLSTVKRFMWPSLRKNSTIGKMNIFIHWWLASHGLAVWIFVATFLVEGQIVTSFLTQPEINYGQLQKRKDMTFEMVTANNDQLLTLCTAFESVVNTELNIAAQNRFWGVRNDSVAAAYDKVIKQLHQTETDFPLITIASDNQLERSSVEFANFSGFLALGLSKYLPETTDTGSKLFHKRDFHSEKNPKLKGYSEVHAKLVWTLLGLLMIHHSCGVLLALIWSKNPVIVSSQGFYETKN
ncbi:LAFA_0A05974g1_1 [Lachancea sp. 'fantastica']|nr:LAFA_0A05974g1_1 [Lachancea sp. 'fantastica']